MVDRLNQKKVPRRYVLLGAAGLGMGLLGCAAPGPSAPQIVEKEVIKTVIVEKPVEIERKVIETVDREVVRTVEIEKPVMIEKEVVRTIEIEKIVTKEVEVFPGLERGGTIIPVSTATPGSFDPHTESHYSSHLILYSVCESLLTLTPELQMGARLANDLEVSKDGLTYTFYLRDDAYFHPPFERKVTADDWVWWVDYAKEQPFMTSYLEKIVSKRAVDNFTFEFTLDKPFPAIWLSFGDPMYPGSQMVSPDAIDEGWNMKTHPIGTGPFYWDEYRERDRVILKKFDKWWGPDDQPYFDDMVWRIIPEQQVAITSLGAGQVDFVNNIVPEVAPAAMRLSGVNTHLLTSTWTWVHPFNCRDPPMNDYRMRKACQHATDYEELIQGSTYGYGTNATMGMIPPDMFWKDIMTPLNYEYSLEQAMALMTEAGYPNGVSINGMIWQDYPSMISDATILKSQWKKIGIDMNIEMVESGEFGARWNLEASEEPNWDFHTNGVAGRYDPDQYYIYFHSKGGVNFMAYYDDEVDSLLDAGRIEPDTNKRAEIYDKFHKKVFTDEQAWTIPYALPWFGALRDNIRGYHPHPAGIPDFNTAWRKTL